MLISKLWRIEGGSKGKAARIDAVQPCNKVAGADEAAQQSRTVEIVGETFDAAAPAHAVTSVPIGCGPSVEMRQDVALEGRDICSCVGTAKEVVERFVIRKMGRSG